MNWWQALLTTFGTFYGSFALLIGLVRLSIWAEQANARAFERAVEAERQRLYREILYRELEL